MRHSFWRIGAVVAAALLAAVIAAPAAWASTPFVDIHSPGPLSDIYIGNDLGCQVRSGGFTSTEFFPNANGPGDCGTFVFLNGDNVSSRLWGPDFANHSTTETSFKQETPFTADTQSLTGSGTAASPFKVTTIVTASAPEQSGTTFDFQITEVDSYVVGNDFYQTDITVKNVGNTVPDNGIQLYHAADCLLRGSNTGLGSLTQSTPACTSNANNSPTAAFEEFTPITTGSRAVETTNSTVWSDVDTDIEMLPNTCDCATNENNGEAIEWFVRSPAIGQSSDTYSLKTQIVDTVPAGGFSLTGPAGSTVGGTVATITDPNMSATASAYSATINWGDGNSSAGTVAGGNGSFTVTGSHSYGVPGTYPVAVTITSVGNSQGSSTVTDSATITASSVVTGAPAPIFTGPPSVTATGASFSGSANPHGLPTTAVFQYGLDPKYSGGGPVVYTNSTPAQPVGSDFASHSLSASVSGLVPNALYHVRLVATNSDGTTFGPDVTFTTGKLPAPGSPTLGKTFNVSVVSGVVLIEVNGRLIPLTELTQIPENTVIDTLHGSLMLTSAAAGAAGARDAAAKGKKHKTPTQAGTFGGAVFKVSQATGGAGKGLVTLAIVEGAVSGAPSFSLCTPHKAGDPSASAASIRTLQLLHASAHGKFRTKGRYSAATVLGTKWTVADRCDGTLTHDITDSVVVNDFVHHKKVVLHAGQSYLARAPGH